MVLPDSPRWLIANGQREEGAKILAMIEDRDSVDHPDVVQKLKEIEVSLAQESAGGDFFKPACDTSAYTPSLRPLQVQRTSGGRPPGKFPAYMLMCCC